MTTPPPPTPNPGNPTDRLPFELELERVREQRAGRDVAKHAAELASVLFGATACVIVHPALAAAFVAVVLFAWANL